MINPKILAFAGSARKASFNKQLVQIAAEGVQGAGLPCTVIDLADFHLPLYNGDLEAENGLPDAAKRLRDLIADHQGFLIASPEYNGSISALLKNTIDWSTRTPEANPDLSGYRGKFAALLSASPGPLGGMRGLTVVRSLLGNLGVNVLANQFTLRQAMKAFTQEGELQDDDTKQRVQALGAELAGIVRAAARAQG